MEELEDQIKEAATAHTKTHFTGQFVCHADPRESFMKGALSDSAKQYWQYGMFTRQQLNEAIEVGVNEGLRKQLSNQ